MVSNGLKFYLRIFFTWQSVKNYGSQALSRYPFVQITMFVDLFLTEIHHGQYQPSSHCYLGDAKGFAYAAEKCFGTRSVKLAKPFFHLQVCHFWVQISNSFQAAPIVVILNTLDSRSFAESEGQHWRFHVHQYCAIRGHYPQ